jgi:hypothetical protein
MNSTRPEPPEYILVRIGQQAPAQTPSAPEPPAADGNGYTTNDIAVALRKSIAPSLILGGIFGGFAFAIGSILGGRLVERYFPERKKRR